jgi:glycosyltransferase involved in cell wall biosynthesis
MLSTAGSSAGQAVPIQAPAPISSDRYPRLANARIALIHDYLFEQGGAEYVVAVLCDLFPKAPLYTSILDRERVSPIFARREVRTSFMQRLVQRKSRARALLPLYPLAFRSFDLADFDIVLSSSSAFAKGITVPDHLPHVCYCHTPAHFIWDLPAYAQSHAQGGFPLDLLAAPLVPALKAWDRRTSRRVEAFLANSAHTAARIADLYGRRADVLHPPVDLAAWSPCAQVDEYYLIVSRLLPYKRIDVAVRAFAQLGLPLRVVGDGPDRQRLQSLAGPSVTFEGRIATEALRERYARCRALILPGSEDLGLTALEAQASGRPVIAYRAGGALETVIEGVTGAFFDSQTPEALAAVIQRFAWESFDPVAVRANAARFDISVFCEGLLAYLERLLETRASPHAPVGEDPNLRRVL